MLIVGKTIFHTLSDFVMDFTQNVSPVPEN